MNSYTGVTIATAVLAGLCSTALAAPPDRSKRQEIDGIEITLAYEEQKQVRQQLERILSQYDLEPWIFTKKIRIAEGIPHSHPVLTITTQPEYLASDVRQLSAFVHEQLHWFEEANREAAEKAVEDLRERYLDVPVGRGDGAGSEQSTYVHLIVCWLEYDAMTELVGKEKAQQILSTADHYRWIYTQVLHDTEEIRSILSRHGLLITPGRGIVIDGNQDEQCILSDENHDFMRRALAEWERAARDLLQLDPTPLPWWIAFDRTCVWHLAADTDRLDEGRDVDLGLEFVGEDVPVRAVVHAGEVRLPDGRVIPVKGAAFTSLYDDDSRPFFVMALLDVWRLDPKAAAEPRLNDIILGAVSHEIVHTRQLVDMNERIERLKSRYSVPDEVHDDIVEERFQDNPGFAAAIEEEIDLFHAAARAHDPSRRADLIRRGLDVARARRVKYFRGDTVVFTPLEDIFLNMEGVATWVSYALGHSTETTDGLERARNTWTQDEGLVLMVLVDELVPDWRDRALGPEQAPPLLLLAEAVDAPGWK